VQTFAERKGDGWVINGQKIWTSLAAFASWMIILCRHDRSDKYKGLTFFMVPIYVHLYVKRQMHNQILYGDAVSHRAKLADMLIGTIAA
jgi:alkylation response protein AidB-like acyl-CoA dehydrogenase